MSVLERLKEVRARVEIAALEAGRHPSDICLIGVSKTKPGALVKEAILAGLEDFGENQVQPYLGRLEEFPKARWHVIGPLQSNKAKLIAKSPPALLHTVDRGSIVKALQKELEKEGQRLSVLIQVNIDEEPQKSGVSRGELKALVEAVLASENLHLSGLMCIPQNIAEAGEGAVRESFLAMKEEADKLSQALSRPMALSMGMSHDFELAIRCGATHVRVGSAIFGSRA